MAHRKAPRASASKPRTSIRTPIDLSEYDVLHLEFVNKQGKPILHIDFDRIADQKPQLSIGFPGNSGGIGIGTTLFDVDA